MNNISVGSVCSGIEAASVAWSDLGFRFKWFSEISHFPSQILRHKYPETPNVGDMRNLAGAIVARDIPAPDLICGGTPCQAFSLAGWKKGLDDDRGNLTLAFVSIINANDSLRLENNQKRTIVLWENVEGVLRDKTNAFGCFLASLAGCDGELIPPVKWPTSGLVRGPVRNIAWRILDAKYFGLPHQRRRLYLVAGGKDFHPEDILFEFGQPKHKINGSPKPLIFNIGDHRVEVFRSYTDCLYSAYGTKWNGNAAAYNGSLFIHQNERLRRLTPLECERLMGFPDNYTKLAGARPTSRYQAIGNSWAIPVVKWIGARIYRSENDALEKISTALPANLWSDHTSGAELWQFGKDLIASGDGRYINATAAPCDPIEGDIETVIDVNAEENFYITPVGCKGILRRKLERGLTMNPRLEEVLDIISSKWTAEEIEKRSRKQKRGRFSEPLIRVDSSRKDQTNLALWDE